MMYLRPSQKIQMWKSNSTRDLTGKDIVKSAFRSERQQVSDMLNSVSKQEAPNFCAGTASQT